MGVVIIMWLRSILKHDFYTDKIAKYSQRFELYKCLRQTAYTNNPIYGIPITYLVLQVTTFMPQIFFVDTVYYTLIGIIITLRQQVYTCIIRNNRNFKTDNAVIVYTLQRCFIQRFFNDGYHFSFMCFFFIIYYVNNTRY